MSKKLSPKIKQEHTIMDEFHDFLNYLADYELVKRIVPGRISRKQSGRSGLYITFAYITNTGPKYNLKKGSTSQELFIICDPDHVDHIQKYISGFSD